IVYLLGRLRAPCLPIRNPRIPTAVNEQKYLNDSQFGGESTAEAASATRDEGDFLGEIKGVVHGIHGCTQRYGEIATE
ncbi:MAG: hypothetical protein QNL08_03930, partial [Ilumatobacteraceae bacterium]